jgi:16S rRNA (cytosine1402-N4)-methyltransferase|uniref:Ribosomal RNA small subunit methyltransferase H n=1 Tax=Dictyoglomus turgidum TaxID=513050 RepID=A0A7C3SS24_9BACT
MEEIEIIHKPVMLDKVLYYLKVTPGKIYVDATCGLGGHSSAILRELNRTGLLIGIDRDIESLEIAKNRLKNYGDNFLLFNTTYDRIPEVLENLNIAKVDGILFDLGFSSYHIEKSKRGFSFQRPEEPLDMRFSKDDSLTAEYILNNFSEEELAEIFYKYGEEPNAFKIARKIVEIRKVKPLKYVGDLLEVIGKSTQNYKRHPATRIFQALRIAVNKELDILERALEITPNILNPQGRIVVITYHSLEDRIVKNFLKNNRDKFEIITKKPVVPSKEEIENNKRARSAKLRVGERRVES